MALLPTWHYRRYACVSATSTQQVSVHILQKCSQRLNKQQNS